MAFLYPLVWMGALAVAAPLVLHLRRRSDASVTRFSALRFLDDQPIAKQDPLNLRDLSLLSLRILALLSLLWAFAGPYLRSLVVRESRVYILDNTLSHQARGALAQARDRLADELAQAPPTVRVAVIELADRPRVLSSFGDPRPALIQRLQTLEPSFARGSYDEAFHRALSLLVAEATFSKRLILYGDGQKNQWDDVLEAPPFRDYAQVGLVVTGSGTANNLSLARPRVRRTVAGTGSHVEFAAGLHHQGPARTVNWSLTAEGRVVANRVVDVAAGAGTVALSADWVSEHLDPIGGVVRIEDASDALPADDRCFFAVPSVNKGSVALLVRSPYLRTALSQEVMQGFWDVRQLSPGVLVKEAQAGSCADVLCMESDFLISADARDLVLRYLGQARGVLLLVDRTSPAIRAFLDRLGFALAESPVSEPRDPSFRYVFSDHPLFRPFRSLDFGSIEDIRVFRFARLTASDAQPLVFAQSGDPLFFEAMVGEGRLLVSAFGFDDDETNWPLHTTFIPFLDLCLQRARRDRQMPTAFEPGQAVVYHLPVGAATEAFVLRQGAREVVRGKVEGRRIAFSAPRLPGIYSLEYDRATPALPGLICVNPSPMESDLTYLASPQSTRAQLQDRFAVEPEGMGQSSTATDRLHLPGQDLWWFGVVAALALLLAEMTWIATWQDRP